MNRIRELREERGLTQSELGEATGIHRTAIARFELGNRKVNVNVARKLCDYFGCSMDDLLNRPETADFDDASFLEAYHAASDRDRKLVDMILLEYIA